MEIIKIVKDWHIIKIDEVYMVQHIPSKEYLGGKCVLTSSKNFNSKKIWRLDSLEEANKRIEFVVNRIIVN